MKQETIFYFLVYCTASTVLGYRVKGTKTPPRAVANPLAATNFKTVVARPSFVDKTLLIKTLLNNSSSWRNVVVTAPRGFGKTTSLDMVRTFLEITVDENGEKHENTVTENFKVFETHNLKIYQDKQLFDAHFGQYPVISIDFKSLGGGTHKEILENLKTIIHKAFQDHGYLLKSKVWTDGQGGHQLDRQLFMKYFDAKKFRKLNKKDVRDGLYFLSQLLFRHFNKKTFLLADEFDSYTLSTIFEASFEMERTVSFITKMMSNVLEGEFNGGSLLVASVRLVQVLSTDDVKHFYFQDNHKYAEHFGFTENDIKVLVDRMNVSFKFEELKKRYGGYRVLGSDLRIYCPLSVVNFLNSRKLASSWVKCDCIPFLDDFFRRYKIGAKVQELLKGETVHITAVDTPALKQIRDLKEIIKAPLFFNDNEYNVALFFNFLSDIGYLTVASKQQNYLGLVVPNSEVGYGLHWDVYTQSYYRKTYKFDPVKEKTLFNNALQKLGKDENSFQEFLESLEGLFGGQVDLPKDDVDFRDLFHFCVHSFTKFEVFDDGRFTGTGRRRDLVVIRPGGVGILVLITSNRGSGLEALQEVITNKYHAILDREKYIRNTILLGVNVDESKRISLSYLVNSTDIDKANNLPKH